jgi:hypothetical protein
MGRVSNTIRDELPGLVVTLAVGVLLGGLLVGFEPVGGDPDRMYRPLKAELARALAAGRLPFWSDRMGLGVPLVSESHVSAFYPPNLVAYRLLRVSTAYRLLMWLHAVALAATTYAYGRQIGLTPWGSALAAVSFSLCGFQAIHATHEPFYCLMPYLPLALLLADVFIASGRLVWLALLALTLGTQWTLGHFQIQSWTNGLVLLTGLWRVVADRRPWRRGAGLIAAVAWGAAIAAVQLALSLEMARTAGHMVRTLHDMSFFSFPPAHWIEPALPWFFRGLRFGAEDPWFEGLRTSGYEACFYVGTAPLIFACVGLFDWGRDRRCSTGVWRLIIPISLALATMPGWWLGGYAAVLSVPGLGLFRAPARYTLLASLGLALLAGQGFDRAIAPRRFRAGMTLAAVLGIGASVFGFLISAGSRFQSAPGLGGLPFGMAQAALTWIVGLAAIAAWRAGKVGPWLPGLVTAAELGALYYLGFTVWGWAIPLPQASPALMWVAADAHVGRVGGVVFNLPVFAGMTTGDPYVGMTLAPMNQVLRAVQDRRARHDAGGALWQRRFGVTHSIWDEPAGFTDRESQQTFYDPALDVLGYRPIGKPARRLWRVVRHPDPFPPARVARVERFTDNWPTLYTYLSRNEARDEVWFYPADASSREPAPLARTARVVSWNGREAVVEHDGSCVLVITRAFDGDWRARVGDGPEAPVLRADGGFQAVRLGGAGPTRVAFRYEPRFLRESAAVSLMALSAACGVLAVAALRAWECRQIQS